MPINKPINYAYRASHSSDKPSVMPTRSAYRSRSEVGGTFFRAIHPGTAGNDITLQFDAGPGAKDR